MRTEVNLNEKDDLGTFHVEGADPNEDYVLVYSAAFIPKPKADMRVHLYPGKTITLDADGKFDERYVPTVVASGKTIDAITEDLNRRLKSITTDAVELKDKPV